MATAFALTFLPTVALAEPSRGSGWTAFDLGVGGITISVTVNGILTRAILDNAASRTLISAELATKAKLPMTQKAALTVRSWGDARQAQIAGSTDVMLGHLSRTVQPIVLPFGSAGPPQPLLFGQDALRGFILQIDPDNKRLRLISKLDFVAPKCFSLVSIPAHQQIDQRSPSNITVMIEGHSVNASLDLGASMALHVSKPFVERYDLFNGRRVSATLSGSIGGFSASPAMSFKEVSLAGHTFKDVPAEVFVAPEEAAVLGLDITDRFHLLLDVEEAKLWLKPIIRRLDQAFHKDLAGLALVPEGEILKVMLVSPGSPADRAGWRIGERVQAIDAVSASAITGRAWKEGPEGAVRHFTMADGSDRTLTLAAFF